MSRHEEVDRNYAAFMEQFSRIAPEHYGMFALMRRGRILGFHQSADAARKHAEELIEDGLFSIQFVSAEPVELGFFTHAVPVDKSRSHLDEAGMGAMTGHTSSPAKRGRGTIRRMVEGAATDSISIVCDHASPRSR